LIDAMDTDEWPKIVGAQEEKIKCLEKKFTGKCEACQVFVWDTGQWALHYNNCIGPGSASCPRSSKIMQDLM